MDNITFEELPKAVAHLIEMVEHLSDKLDEMVQKNTQQQDGRILLNLSDVAALLGKSTYTIYAMTSDKRIPFYKKGNKLYFFEDEIIQWIEEGESGALYKDSDFDRRLEELRNEKRRKPSSIRNSHAIPRPL